MVLGQLFTDFIFNSYVGVCGLGGGRADDRRPRPSSALPTTAHSPCHTFCTTSMARPRFLSRRHRRHRCHARRRRRCPSAAPPLLMPYPCSPQVLPGQKRHHHLRERRATVPHGIDGLRAGGCVGGGSVRSPPNAPHPAQNLQATCSYVCRASRFSPPRSSRTADIARSARRCSR